MLLFHMVLQDTISHQASSPEMMPSTVNEDDTTDSHLTPPREPHSRHAETAPLLPLSISMPMHWDLLSVPLLPSPDEAGNSPNQELNSARSNSPQPLSIVFSSLSPDSIAPGLPPSSPAQNREAGLTFVMPTPGHMDQEKQAPSTTASVPPTTTPSTNRYSQGAVVDYPMMGTADLVPDSPVGGEFNGHARALNAPTTASIEATKISHRPSMEQPTPPASGEFMPSPIAELQSSPPMGTSSKAGTTLEADWSSGDRPDTPTGGDLNAPSTPRTQNPRSAETALNYAVTHQRASGIHETSTMATHTGPTDQLGFPVEPMPIIEQLIHQLPIPVQDGHHELRLRLTPENLGTVLVDISADRLEVHARLLVENPAVKETLEANLPKLRDALQAQGLHVQDISVSVGLHTPQQDSMAGHPSYEERPWALSKGLMAGKSARDMTTTTEQLRQVTDSRQVDLFI